MTPRTNTGLWAGHFFRSLKVIKYPADPWEDSQWTQFMGKVVADVAKNTGCYAAMRRKKAGKDEYSGEYLNIDAIFFDLESYDLPNVPDNWDPFVLPRVVVELENSYDPNKIAYCLWKLLCIRSPLRILICYQKGQGKVQGLRKHLTDVTMKGGLMKDNKGQLLVLIGDDSVGEDVSWEDYYMVFEWRAGRLAAVTAR